jgi:hypothetical protein
MEASNVVQRRANSAMSRTGHIKKPPLLERLASTFRKPETPVKKIFYLFDKARTGNKVEDMQSSLEDVLYEEGSYNGRFRKELLKTGMDEQKTHCLFCAAFNMYRDDGPMADDAGKILKDICRRVATDTLSRAISPDDVEYFLSRNTKESSEAGAELLYSICISVENHNPRLVDDIVAEVDNFQINGTKEQAEAAGKFLDKYDNRNIEMPAVA